MMKTMPLMWCVAAVSAAVVMALPAPADAKITKELKEELQPAIVKGLESADPLEKAFAILAAGQLKDRTLDKQLLPYLENTNTDVRRAAIVAMASRKDKKGIAALEKEILKAGSGGDFVMTEMMARFPEAIQAAILKNWITGRKIDPKIKASAMTYTARFGRGTVYKLMGAVTSQRKDADRKVYLDLLIANPRVEAAGWAEKLLTDKRNAEARLGGLRLAMAIGGAKVDPIIRKALTDADPRISGIALDYLAEAGDLSATDFLIKQLNVSKDKITVAEQLLALDAKVPYDVASKFAASVSKDSGKLAELAQGILGSSRDPKALEALLALEGSTIILDRRLGVAGLGYTKSAKAATVLHRTLFDGHQELRTLSANGLGAIGLGESLSHLDKALRGAAGNKDFKYALVSAIGKIKTPSAAQKLTYLIRDRDPKVKALALDGLERIGDKTAIEALRTVVSLDPNPEIKFRAALIILRADKANGMAQIGTALQRPPQDYLDSVMALPPNLRNAIVLDHLLKHEKEKIRTETLDGLNYAGEVGLPLLRKATAKGFPKDVRDGAIQALSRHTADADINLFKSLAQTGNDDEKMLAVQWLIRKSNASLAGFFRTLMNGSKGDPARRMAAVYALLKSNA